MKLLIEPEMKAGMKRIVQKCIELHGGGEEYFDELDGLIKEDKQFIISFFSYITQESETKNIIVSGELGNKIAALRNKYNWWC